MKQLRILGALSAALLWGNAVFGATTGTIRGTVSDPTGATVAHARVVVIDEQMAQARELETPSSGAFEFDLLPVGDYTLRVEGHGFRTYSLTGVHLTVNQVATFAVTLQVGRAESTIQVEANPLQVDTVTTQMGTVIDTGPVQDLPLNGRNVYQFISLQPGITTTGGADPNNPAASFAGGSPLVFSSSGGRTDANDFMIDGANANEDYGNQAAIRIIPDAVQEFRVVTNTFNAEYGRNSGSIVNIVTKSGTKQWHGNAFEFLRNDVLNARNYFENSKASYKLNEFGGTLGGPVYKNKTFVFGSFQATRERKGLSGQSVLVFSNKERTGDFSDTVPFSGSLTNPLCFPTDSPNPTQCFAPGTPYSIIFPSNSIPLTSFNPVAEGILTNYIPHPNTGSNYFTESPVQPLNSYQGTLKIDHQLSSRNAFSGVYLIDDQTQTTQVGNIPAQQDITPQRQQQINLSETFVKSAATLNEFHVSYLRSASVVGVSPQLSPASLGFTGITPGPPQSLQSLPVFDILGGPHIGLGSSSGGSGAGALYQNNYQLTDNLSKTVGSHSMKFGTDFRWVRQIQLVATTFDGAYVYGGGPNSTGNALADFVLGLPTTYSQGSAQDQHVQTKQFHLYAQDGWHVRQNLTLNYGLRWELNTPWTEKNNQLEVFRFPSAPGQPAPQSRMFPTAPPGYLFPGDPGVPKGLTQTYKKAFAPRLGLAYSPGWINGNKVVVKAAYGIFYNTMAQAVIFQEAGEPPFGGFNLVPAPGFATPFVTQSGQQASDPYPFVPAHAGQLVDFSQYYPILMFGNLPPHLSDESVEQYNLVIDYQLSPTLLLSVGYVGSQGHHLLGTYDQNAGNAALCLQLLSQGCGPYGEDSTYVDNNGNNIYGTRPAGTFSNNGVSEAFTNVFTQAGIAQSSYNSLQARLEHRAANATFLAAYTYSKAMDNASGFENSLNPTCFKCDISLSGNDARHRFNFSFTYELPLGRYFGTNGLKGKLIDGWETGGIYTYQSGVPVHLTDSSSDNSLTGSYSFETVDRPEIVGPIQFQDPHKSGCAWGTGGSSCISVPTQFFNPNAFDFEPLGKIGNARHNMFPGPPINNLDFSLIKRMKFTERYVMEFRSEFFNLFNHTQFLNPNGDISAGNSFGQISGARDPRFVQFGLKMMF